MNEIIAALWEMSWWELAWVYLVIQWIVLVKFWPFYVLALWLVVLVAVPDAWERWSSR